MPQLVEVRFKGNRKAYFEWHEPEPLRSTEPVIVESDRGLDFGTVSATGRIAEVKCERCSGCALNGEHGEPGARTERGAAPPSRHAPEPTRKVLRRASVADRRAADDLRRTEDDVRRKVRERAGAHNLVMKVSDAEWQWDRNKLTVYFTAEKRVDFRALVRDLASHFRTRIEMRQIGVRDEAARLSGIGRCGRELCSASWLPELRPIGLQIAKDQRLSLNPAQISGPCGRLLCCLRYEHEFYVQQRKRFPKEGKVLQTAKGLEKVAAIDIFREAVTLRAEDGTARTVPLAELKQEVERGGAPAAAVAPAPATGTETRPPARPDTARHPERPPAAAPTAETGQPGDATDQPAAAPEAGAERRRRRRNRRRHRP